MLVEVYHSGIWRAMEAGSVYPCLTSSSSLAGPIDFDMAFTMFFDPNPGDPGAKGDSSQAINSRISQQALRRPRKTAC